MTLEVAPSGFAPKMISAECKALSASLVPSAWSDVDYLRGSQGKYSLRQDIRSLARLRGQFAIFSDPAGQESFGGYFDPLLEQRGDFFAQIGGVVQTRELEAFKRGVGRFVQVMPRWSHPVGSHG